MSRIRSPQYWRNLAFAVGLALACGGLIVAAFVAVQASHSARDVLTPPRVPVDGPPPDGAMAHCEDISFVASDGITLRGWYVPPENGAVIILAHGYAQNRLAFLLEAQALVERRYGVLLFDFRGHGESEGKLVTIGDHEQRDLAAAVDFVAAQPDVKKIGAVGFSMGAATLVSVAARDERLGAMVVEAAFPDLAEEIRYRSRVFGPLSQLPALWTIQRMGVNFDRVRPVDDICAVSPRPVLLIYGELDGAMPPGSIQAMTEAACDPTDLWIIRGAGHQNYAKVIPEEYTTRLLGFFDAWTER